MSLPRGIPRPPSSSGAPCRGSGVVFVRRTLFAGGSSSSPAARREVSARPCAALRRPSLLRTRCGVGLRDVHACESTHPHTPDGSALSLVSPSLSGRKFDATSRWDCLCHDQLSTSGQYEFIGTSPAQRPSHLANCFGIPALTVACVGASWAADTRWPGLRRRPFCRRACCRQVRCGHVRTSEPPGAALEPARGEAGPLRLPSSRRARRESGVLCARPATEA